MYENVGALIHYALVAVDGDEGVMNDSVGKFDFRRDVLLFLSTQGGWYAPPGRKKALAEWGLSPLFEFPNRVMN